ncbi:MAG: P1 family peptidase [Acetobacteraceae bacterium]|nr:P1 family peptidase [Acetobacteraceae bacterium]
MDASSARGSGRPAPPGPARVPGAPAGGRPRAREAGLCLGRLAPGPNNAITDVPGVRVGHVTLIRGRGPLVPGRGPVRTGVTAILPHGDNPFLRTVPAAVEVINGFGKAVGLVQVRELGRLETPVLLTGTLNVARAADALIDHMIRLCPGIGIDTRTVNPVVLECSDAYLNDIQGRHVRRRHVLSALEGAGGGPVEEGSVGAGTGMTCFGFKGGVGTASRLVPELGGVLGALVLANFGRRGELVIAGVPVGRLLLEAAADDGRAGPGSVVVVLATDMALSSRQLGRLARRAVAGLARVGWAGDHGSGDFVLAFSNAGGPVRAGVEEDGPFGQMARAAVEATEEAVVNALFAATDMEGRDGRVVPGLPVAEVVRLLRARGALSGPGPEGG